MTNPDDPRLLRLAEEDNVCAVRSVVPLGESILVLGCVSTISIDEK